MATRCFSSADGGGPGAELELRLDFCWRWKLHGGLGLLAIATLDEGVGGVREEDGADGDECCRDDDKTEAHAPAPTALDLGCAVVDEAAPSFPTSFPHLFKGKDNLRCLIPCAIDQDPYFRMTRDVAPRIGYKKPALIESSFFPALQGETGKMSASDPNSAIYVTDSAEDIKNKVNGYAFSGGQDSVELHRKYRANLEVDIPYKYFSFFLEDDDELNIIKEEYGSGRMLTREIKNKLIDMLSELVERYRTTRAAVTDQMVDAFMAVRPLPYMFS